MLNGHHAHNERYESQDHRASEHVEDIVKVLFLCFNAAMLLLS